MNPTKKKFLFIIILLNAVLLISGLLYIFHGHQDDITLYDIPLHDSRGPYENTIHSDGNTMFSTEYPVSKYQFIGRTDALESGIYTIKLYYSTDHDYYSISCDTGMDGNPYPALYAESYTMSALYHEFSYRIWVNSATDYLNVRIHCGNSENYKDIFESDSYFSLEKIEISRDYRTTVIYKFVKLMTLLLCVNGVLCICWNIRKIQDNFYVILGLLCIFMVSSLSLMSVFQAEGHDTMFHYARIVGLAEGLLGGDFPVRVQPGWLHGYGYATSICYGDLLLYFPAILYIFGVPLIHAYKLYVAFINLGTLLISYFCFKKVSCSRAIGVTCAAIYCLSISRILNIYLRAAVGEYSAFMFLPLIILGIQQIYDGDTNRTDANASKYSNNGWLLLALGMTGIIQTHILSVMMVCIFIALTVLVLIRKLSKGVFLSFVKSVLASFLLNLGFLLPFAEYSLDTLQVFDLKTSYGIQRYGLSIYELFSFGTTAAGRAYDALSGSAKRFPASLGLAVLIIILLSFLVLAKCHDWKPGEKERLIFVLALSEIAVWMSTYYFPWNRIASVSFLNDNVASIQFPWRFLSIAIPLLTYMACFVFLKIKESIGPHRLTYLLAGVCFISALQGLYCMDLITRNAESYAIFYDNRPNMNLSKIVSNGEYLLAGTNANETWTDLDVSGENIQAEILDRDGLCMDVSCQAGTNAWIEFPIFAYQYYRCSDMATGTRYPVMRGNNNKIHVDLPDNYEGTLKIDYVEPWHWRLAEAVSIISFIAVIVYVFHLFKKRKALAGQFN